MRTVSCHLLKSPLGWIFQLMLFVFGASIVVFDWRTEPRTARRTTRRFVSDSTVLGAGSVLGHFLNIAILLGIENKIHSVMDECALYGIFYVLDFTICTFLYYCIYENISFQHITFLNPVLKKMSEWVICICLTKVIFFGCFALLLKFFLYEEFLQNYTAPLPVNKELFVVSFIIPCICNSVQLWLTNRMIKRE